MKVFFYSLAIGTTAVAIVFAALYGLAALMFAGVPFL